MSAAYRFPPGLAIQVTVAALFGARRGLRGDARRCIETLRPPVCFLGEENIPASGPFLLLMNHYYRPGFAVWWLSLAVSSRLQAEHAWVIASQWTAAGKWYGPLREAASRLLFTRLAKVYGFLPMPPMPPRPEDTMARADAVRAVLSYVESHPQSALCLAPEGRDILDGRLGWPASGAGRFIALLAARMPILPVGGWEQDGVLTVRFGAPYRLKIPVINGGQMTRERDRLVSGTVMRSIAALLPESMRGEFA
jgi:hypothetical protein